MQNPEIFRNVKFVVYLSLLDVMPTSTDYWDDVLERASMFTTFDYVGRNEILLF